LQQGARGLFFTGGEFLGVDVRTKPSETSVA